MKQPKWNDYMAPVLRILSDGKEWSRNPLINAAADFLGLDETAKGEVLASGELIYKNRCGWAITYLKQSGLIDSPKRASFKISPSGIALHKQKPDCISTQDLMQYPGYVAFTRRTNSNSTSTDSAKSSEDESPEEVLYQSEKEIRESVCAELLEKARSMSDKAFEGLVVKLLLAMGYGDKSDPNSGFVVGQSGDGGIDGVINQDTLGLDKIYVQAKRYKEGNKVSPHDVRDFGGAMAGTEGQDAKKGVFITTSDFTQEGRDYAKKVAGKFSLILINGETLAELMYKYGIGVSLKSTITINKVDYDFFDE